MLTPDEGATPQAVEAAPVVDGAQPAKVGNDAASGVDAPKLPGWIGQLTAEQQAEIKARVAADPKELDQIPKGLTELYSNFSQLKAQSVGALKVPAADAPKEAWDQFYAGLGRPESAEGYTLEKPQIPAGMRYDEAQEKWFRQLAHTAGLNQAQAKGIFDQWNKLQEQNYQAMIQSRVQKAAQATETLKQEWQTKYEENMEYVKLGFHLIAPQGTKDEAFKELQRVGLDNNPNFLKKLAELGKRVGPAKTVVPTGITGSANEGPTFTVGKGLVGRQ